MTAAHWSAIPLSSAEALGQLAAAAAGRARISADEIWWLADWARAAAAARRGEALDLLAALDRSASIAAQWCCAALEEALGRAAEACARLVRLGEGEEEESALRLLAISRLRFAGGDAEGAWRALRRSARLARDARTLRAIDRLYRKSAKTSPPASPRKMRLALLGGVTFDAFAPLARAQAFGAGIELELYMGPFGQYRQEALDPNSRLAAFAPEVVFVLPGPSAAAPDIADTRRFWTDCAATTGAFVIQANLETPPFEPSGSLAGALPGGLAHRVREYNLAVAAEAAARSGVAILDLDQCAARFGRDRWRDESLWHAARQYPAPQALSALGHQLTAVLRAVVGLTAKCVAVDLDGTLWGGVIGEDGLAGIQLGGSAAGEAFVAFQKHLKALASRGILLAACSKNNPEDARLPFREHPEMILREDDFAVFLANWKDKEENLLEIARTVNIGPDSIVFVDDNPAERARIRQNLPAVEVVALPPDPAGYAAALDRLGVWESLGVTEEDRLRAASIRQNIERADLEAAAGGDRDAFLRSLEMEIRLFPFDEVNLPRIVQLINKTNQFNLTTRRRTEAEVRALLETPGIYTQAVRVSDRFGDSGLTGVLIALPDGDGYCIDTWLLSCRVMGRRIEELMFGALARRAEARGARWIEGEHLPTAKNAPVRDLYPALGCELVGESDAGKRYRWTLGVREFPVPATARCDDRTAASNEFQFKAAKS